MIVGLIEVEAKTPIVIVSKKAKGGFLETTDYIPSSTILGGVARQIVIDNYSKGLGNCAKLRGPNDFPQCENCGAKDKCAYNYIWIEKRLKLSYFLPSNQKNFEDPPPIPSLQSLFKSREEELFIDGLLLMALYRMSLRKEAKEDILLKKLETKEGPCKKSDASVRIEENGAIKSLKITLNDAPHVAINPQLKTSETGYLYSYTMLSRGTKLTGLAVGDEQIIDENLNNSTISVGTGKSRGNGIVKLAVTKKQSLDEYTNMRGKLIKEGFEEIGKNINEFLERAKENLLFGTITGLSPLPIKSGSQPPENVAQRIDIPSNQIIHLSYKMGTHIRYEFNGGENFEPTFILSPVINPGYAGVFSIEGDLEKVSLNLAKREVDLTNYQPWFGWITINHPIHYLNVRNQIKG
jgi:hypothetical protein